MNKIVADKIDLIFEYNNSVNDEDIPGLNWILTDDAIQSIQIIENNICSAYHMSHKIIPGLK